MCGVGVVWVLDVWYGEGVGVRCVVWEGVGVRCVVWRGCGC